MMSVHVVIAPSPDDMPESDPSYKRAPRTPELQARVDEWKRQQAEREEKTTRAFNDLVNCAKDHADYAELLRDLLRLVRKHVRQTDLWVYDVPGEAPINLGDRIDAALETPRIIADALKTTEGPGTQAGAGGSEPPTSPQQYAIDNSRPMTAKEIREEISNSPEHRFVPGVPRATGDLGFATTPEAVEVEENRQDAERFEWLRRNFGGVICERIFASGKFRIPVNGKLRETVDAAMLGHAQDSSQ